MNEKALVYIIWYLGYVILMHFVCRWMWEEICVSAGKGPAEVMARRKEICGSSRTYKKMYIWLLGESPEPKRTKKWIYLYQIATLLPSVGVLLSVMGLFTHAFDSILDTGVWVTLGYMFFMAFAGIARRLTRK